MTLPMYVTAVDHEARTVTLSTAPRASFGRLRGVRIPFDRETARRIADRSRGEWRAFLMASQFDGTEPEELPELLSLPLTSEMRCALSTPSNPMRWMNCQHALEMERYYSDLDAQHAMQAEGCPQ